MRDFKSFQEIGCLLEGLESTQEAEHVQLLMLPDASEAFRLTHAAILSALTISLSSSKETDGRFVTAMLHKLLQHKHVAKHVGLVKAANLAIEAWEDSVSSSLKFLRPTCTDILAPFLFLLAE